MPTSCASARSLPHPHRPRGRCGTHSSGMLTHGIALPLAPCCFPGLRPEFVTRFGAGFVLPGRSSLEGGMEELPLFREARRSSWRTRSSSATLDSRNRSTTAISSSRDSSSNPDTAQDHHISQPTDHTRHAEDQTTDLNVYRRVTGQVIELRAARGGPPRA
jgi:hypothetical protein